MWKRGVLLGLCLCLLGTCVWAAPKEKLRKGKPADQEVLDLTAPFVQTGEVVVDGNVSEWGDENAVSFKTLLSGEYEADWTGPKDLSATVSAMYSPDRIYFYIKVRDNAVVSKKRQWKSDRVEIWLAPESSQGKSLSSPKGLLLDVGPAVDGGQPTVKWISGAKGDTGAKAVAFVGPEGYDFEASIEYSALAKESPVMGGALRYCVLVRDWDQDDENEDEAAIGTCPISPAKSSGIKPASMGKIPMNLSDAIWNSMLSNNVVDATSNWKKVLADVGGSKLTDIVTTADRKLVVAGFGLPDDDRLSFYSLELACGPSLNSPELEVRDINGDKKPEIILTRTEKCINGESEATRQYVFKYENGRGLGLLANYITEVKNGDKSVKNNYKFSKQGLTQTVVKGSSEDLTSCELEGDGDIIPFMLPQSGEKSRNITLHIGN